MGQLDLEITNKCKDDILVYYNYLIYSYIVIVIVIVICSVADLDPVFLGHLDPEK